MTFNNNSSQAERKQVLKDTMFNRASSEANEIGGRWSKPTQVNASQPVVNYPAGPNWSVDPTGPEPPLNQDVNAMEPCGQPWEIEKSLDERFELQRSLRDGVPLEGVIARYPEPTPDTEAIRASSADHARHSPAVPGRHSVQGRRVSPSNSIKRRLR
jgi:hypothetical protein